MVEFRKEKLQEILQNLTDDDKFSGTVLVAKDGESIYEGAFGLACKRFNVPNEIDTKFNLGSLNKTFTKLAILQLEERGLLELDDLVGKHIPDIREDIGSKVSIRHLLMFTSGLGDYFNEKFLAAIGRLRKVDDFIAFFIDDPLLFEPGEKMQYSNAGYVLLGKIIEVVSGQDYYDYIRENIYRSAGMNDSDHYELDYPVPNLATGYTLDPQCCSSERTSDRRNNYYHIGTRGSPAGGGISTVRDLLRFDNAVANNLLLNSENSARVFRPINAPPTATSPLAILAGGAPGLTALYLKFFKKGYVVFVLSNYDPDQIEPLADEIRKLFISDEELGQVKRMVQDD